MKPRQTGRMTRLARRFAAAKVNLALHITGQRSDGFHLLDSLVCFADIGDVLTVELADPPSLKLTGPMAAAVPLGADNLILRAARLMAPDVAIRITLEKNLPVAAGIGGGSADAAACLLALRDVSDIPLPHMAALLSLGADVPVCLKGRPVRMRGIGEEMDKVRQMPVLDAVLLNPGVAVSTPEVFARLAQKKNPPLGPLPGSSVRADWVRFLSCQRNDLGPPAQTLAPVIGKVLEALEDSDGCVLARMSGSGATCFGLFRDRDTAKLAASKIAAHNPRWWVRPTRLG